MSYYFVYIVLPVLLFALFSKREYAKYYYLFFFVLSLISYDNVSDYSMYVKFFQQIQEYGEIRLLSGKLIEPGWILLNKAFSFSRWGYLIVFAISIFSVYYMFYAQLKKYGLLLWGTFTFIAFGLITKHENVLRQNIAIAIGFYSFRYINKKFFLKYVISTIIAVFFHYSAIFLIPFYFVIRYLSHKDIKPLTSFLLIISGIIMVKLNLFYIIFSNVMKLVPYYNEYHGALFVDKIANFSTIGASGIILALISWLPHWYISKYHKSLIGNQDVRLIVNASWFITVFTVWFYQLPVLSRPFDYILWYQILGISLFLKLLYLDFKRTSNKSALLFLSVIFIILLGLRYRIIDGYYGNYKYKTIFSEQCSKQEYYVRFKLLEGEEPNERDNKFVIKTHDK